LPDMGAMILPGTTHTLVLTAQPKTSTPASVSSEAILALASNSAGLGGNGPEGIT